MQVLNSLPILTTDCQFSSTNLEQIVEHYETLITNGDTSSHSYWYLGLAYLLQSREIDAQATWFIPFEEASELESAILNGELSDVLDRAASQELTNHNLEDSWLISQYLREIDSTHIHNLLRSILLTIKLELFTPEDLVEWQGVEVISTYVNPDVNRELLDLVLSLLLDFPSEFTHQFIYQCLLSFSDIRSDLIKLISNALLIICHRASTNTFMTQILEDCLKLEPLNTIVLQILWQLNCGLAEHKKATDLSFVIYSLCNDSYQKVIANANIIRTLLSAGDWQTVIPIIDQEPADLAIGINENLLISATFLPYTADCPDYYRSIQNQVSQNYLKLNHRQSIISPVKRSTLLKQIGVIRVGYLASTLCSHSVGWLSRWLWQYHDRTKFQIFKIQMILFIKDGSEIALM
jgi:predicted O-linked N-acetylglucosamine transferase (SPINDLY family)